MQYTEQDHTENLAKIAILRENVPNDVDLTLEPENTEGTIEFTNQDENLNAVEKILRDSEVYKNAKEFFEHTADRTTKLLNEVNLLKYANQIEDDFRFNLDLETLNLGSTRHLAELDKKVDKKIENILTAIQFESSKLEESPDLHDVTKLAVTRKIQSKIKQYIFLEQFIQACATINEILLQPDISPDQTKNLLSPYSKVPWETLLSKQTSIPSVDLIKNAKLVEFSDINKTLNKMLKELAKSGSWNNLSLYQLQIKNNEVALENSLASNTQFMKLANKIMDAHQKGDKEKLIEHFNDLIQDLITLDKKYYKSIESQSRINQALKKANLSLPLKDVTFKDNIIDNILTSVRNIALATHYNDAYTTRKFGTLSDVKEGLIQNIEHSINKLEHAVKLAPPKPLKPIIAQQSFDF